MWKDKKIIGAGILLVMTLFILGIVFVKDKPQKLSQEEIENMFVDVKANGESDFGSKNKEESKLNENDEASKPKDNKSKNDNSNNNSVLNEDNNKEELKKKLIVVEVRGEVKKPNVYYIEQGKVVNDLINEAGGLTEEADISNINRAKELNNHELVFINNKNNPQEVNAEILNGAINSNYNADNKLSDKKETSKEEKSSGLININKASKGELMTLPSVGEKTADKIIQYREENGGFKTIEDLKNVDRIGDKTLEKLKDKITV